MSVVSSTRKHAVRIFALPLATRSRAKGLTECLTYYHFETPTPPEGATQGWTTRVQHKAAELWANLGRAPEGNWRVRHCFLRVRGLTLIVYSAKRSYMESASLTVWTSKSLL